MISTRLKSIVALALVFLALFTIPSNVECANNKKSSPSAEAAHEPTIEEVNAKQLERILAEKDYVAVYWCKFFPFMDHHRRKKVREFGLSSKRIKD
jgi:hypothetical protein